MSWATPYIERLKAGEVVSFRPSGNSMMPRIKSGQLCTVEPLSAPVAVGDIVLCKVGRAQYLHLVGAVAPSGQCLITNNHGRINGWALAKNIYGRLVKVEI